jgi:hypothetical protein
MAAHCSSPKFEGGKVDAKVAGVQLCGTRYKVRYKKGVENVVADCLSRNIADTPEDNVFLVHANMAMTLTQCMTQSIEQEAMCTISSAKAFPSQAVQLQRKIEKHPMCGLWRSQG